MEGRLLAPVLALATAIATPVAADTLPTEDVDKERREEIAGLFITEDGTSESGSEVKQEHLLKELRLDNVHEVLGSDKPSIIVISATWCGPCKTLKKALPGIDKTLQDKLNFGVVMLDVNYETGKNEVRNPEADELMEKLGVAKVGGIPAIFARTPDGNTELLSAGWPGLPKLETQIADHFGWEVAAKSTKQTSKPAARKPRATSTEKDNALASKRDALEEIMAERSDDPDIQKMEIGAYSAHGGPGIALSITYKPNTRPFIHEYIDPNGDLLTRSFEDGVILEYQCGPHDNGEPRHVTSRTRGGSSHDSPTGVRDIIAGKGDTMYTGISFHSTTIHQIGPDEYTNTAPEWVATTHDGHRVTRVEGPTEAAEIQSPDGSIRIFVEGMVKNASFDPAGNLENVVYANQEENPHFSVTFNSKGVATQVVDWENSGIRPTTRKEKRWYKRQWKAPSFILSG